MIIYGVYKMFTSEVLFGTTLLIFGISLMTYHNTIMEDSWRHRKFPHTFTFEVFASIMFSLCLLFMGVSLTTSLVFLVISFIYFTTHIIIDGFLDEAIKRDKKFWASNNRIKKELILCRY